MRRILREKLHCPCDFVLHALSVWLASRPQLKVFESVVVADPVLVVNVFLRSKRPTEMFGHCPSMLCYVPRLSGVWMARLDYESIAPPVRHAFAGGRLICDNSVVAMILEPGQMLPAQSSACWRSVASLRQAFAIGKLPLAPSLSIVPFAQAAGAANDVTFDAQALLRVGKQAHSLRWTMMRSAVLGRSDNDLAVCPCTNVCGLRGPLLVVVRLAKSPTVPSPDTPKVCALSCLSLALRSVVLSAQPATKIRPTAVWHGAFATDYRELSGVFTNSAFSFGLVIVNVTEAAGELRGVAAADAARAAVFQ